MPVRTFDRVPQFDQRSRAYPIRQLVTATVPRSYTWRSPVVLDQGSEGACVGFGWAHEIAAPPIGGPWVTNDLARMIYREAKRVDEWAGENYEGTSVLAGAKVMRTMGRLVEYRWAFGLDDLILAVGWHGPAVLGVWWHEDMMEPGPPVQSPTGALLPPLVTPTGGRVGGHCIEVEAVSVAREDFTLLQSWGAGHGLNGRVRVSWDSMGLLLADDGEAAIPVVRR